MQNSKIIGSLTWQFTIIHFQSCLARFFMMKQFKHLLEKSAFGVCSYLGEKMGIASATVRLYFIYISFITLGSPLLLYFFAAFWLNIRRYLKSGKNLLWG